MERFHAKDLIQVVEELCSQRLNFLALDEKPIDKDEISDTIAMLDNAERVAGLLDLKAVISKLRHSKVFFSRDFPITGCTGENEIRNIEESFQDALLTYQFIKVAPGREVFIERFLMGKVVQQKFPSAVLDIWDAKACLMAGCETAAIFHLMRLAEHGMRHIARKLQITLIHKKMPISVEYADWQKVIDGIGSKIKAERQLAPSKRREAMLNFYSDIGRPLLIYEGHLAQFHFACKEALQQLTPELFSEGSP